MKKCSICKRDLDREMFYNNKSKKDGLSFWCKECYKVYHQKNKEKINEHKRVYHQNSREIRKVYLQKNKEKIKERCKMYYKNNKEKITERIKIYHQNNKEKMAEKATEYRQKNKKHIRECRRIYELYRRHNEIEYKLKKRLRCRLYLAIKNNQRKGSAVRDLGCTVPEVKEYIEKQFKEGMNWNNWGYNGWHIDHITPLDYFDLTDKEQLLKAVHYTNLQPMWAEENLSKGCKLV